MVRLKNLFICFLKVLFKYGKPIQLIQYVTARCNLRCEHCFYKETLDKPDPGELSPEILINVAKKAGVINAAIVNAGQIFPMESVHKAVQHNLINPVFIGDKNEINKHAEKLGWNTSKYKIIDEKDENNTAPIAAKLASEGKIKILVKGHIHTDVLIKAVLKKSLNLIGKKRLSHVWHMTLSTDDKPFIKIGRAHV